MNMKHIIYIILLVCSLCSYSHKVAAQTDPVLAGMIIKYTNTASKQYERQMAAMSTNTEGHIWLKSEVESVNKSLKEFDDYLNSFQKVLSYAAQAYGFFYEIGNLCDNMKSLTRQIGSTPTNAIAVALHNKRNDIYIDVGQRCVGVVKNIRELCIDKKMTEKDRITLVLSIRPQLQAINNQLYMLVKLVRYTNMSLVWNEIVQGSKPHTKDKSAIVKRCLETWKLNANNTKPNK